MHAAHAPWQSLKPALHVRPHVCPSQLAVPFAEAQAVQLLPHESTEVLDTHRSPHR